MQIYMIKADSSNVDSYGYSEVDKILRIKFKSGSIYDYLKVPIVIYQRMRDAQSKGKFIRELKEYKFNKIN